MAALRRPEGAAVTAVAASRADLSVPILSDGTLEPPAGGELRAPDRATVAGIPAREGQRVARGEALVVLENATLSTSARDAKSQVAELESERVAAEVELANARAEAARLKKVVESDQRLLAEGAITRGAADADAFAAAAAGERERAARVKLESLTGSRMELAGASSRELSQRAEALTVRAPADGVVYSLPRKVGESVDAGQVVASVVDPEHRRLRARVDQPDLPRIAAGQRLIVDLRRAAGRAVGGQGRRWSSPGLRDVGGRQVGEVLGEIADPTAQLPPNAAVDVQIVAGGEEAAPSSCRARASSATASGATSTSLDDGRARRREVTVGLLGLTEVEIASGVSEGETRDPARARRLSDGAPGRGARSRRADRAMFNREVFGMALDRFRKHPVQTSLTLAGLVVGTAAIILVVTLGLTGRGYVLAQIEGVGSHLVWANYEGTVTSGVSRALRRLHDRAGREGDRGARATSSRASRRS